MVGTLDGALVVLDDGSIVGLAVGLCVGLDVAGFSDGKAVSVGSSSIPSVAIPTIAGAGVGNVGLQLGV